MMIAQVRTWLKTIFLHIRLLRTSPLQHGKLSKGYCSGLINAANRHLRRKKYLPLSNF